LPPVGLRAVVVAPESAARWQRPAARLIREDRQERVVCQPRGATVVARLLAVPRRRAQEERPLQATAVTREAAVLRPFPGGTAAAGRLPQARATTASATSAGGPMGRPSCSRLWLDWHSCWCAVVDASSQQSLVSHHQARLPRIENCVSHSDCGVARLRYRWIMPTCFGGLQARGLRRRNR